MLVKDVKEREKGLRAMIELSGVIHLKTLGGGGGGGGGRGYAVSLKYPGRRASEQYGLVQSTSLYNPHLKFHLTLAVSSSCHVVSQVLVQIL